MPVVLEDGNLQGTYRQAGGRLERDGIVHAVADVSFSVRKEQPLGIVGES